MKTKKPAVKKPPVTNLHLAANLTRLRFEVEDLKAALTAALARKPNGALNDLAYQLKVTRAELAMVQEELAKNNGQIAKLISATDSLIKLLAPIRMLRAATEAAVGA